MTITKKIIFIIGIILFAIPTYAVDMCASDNAFVVILDKSINPTSTSYGDPSGSWRAYTSNGTIVGVSACLSGVTCEGEYTSNNDVCKGLLINTNTNSYVVGGEKTGCTCWCKMTHPAESFWYRANLYVASYSCPNGCYNGCAKSCGERIKDNGGNVTTSMYWGLGVY